MVANRFGLWSIWTGGLTAVLGFVFLSRLVGAWLGVGMDAAPQALAVIRIVLLVLVAASVVAIGPLVLPARALPRLGRGPLGELKRGRGEPPWLAFPSASCRGLAPCARDA